MIDVRTEIALIEKKYPNKRMRGDPGEWNGKFTFQFIDKNITEDEAKWDAGIIAVDKVSGAISEFNAFANRDFWENEKPITEY